MQTTLLIEDHSVHDIVVTRAHVLTGNWQALYDEVRTFRAACGDAHLKAILATGELATLTNVARASVVAMQAGADFIKTSTGKEGVNATMPFALVMARMIREFHEQTGYAIGFKAGPRIFTREDSLLFHRRHLIRTREFYERYGGKTIVLARFIPIIRTFAPVVAGVGQMAYRRFLFFNVFGGIGWVAGLTWAGYLLGKTVPNIDRHIHLVVAVVIVLSVLPIVGEILKTRRKKRIKEVPWRSG